MCTEPAVEDAGTDDAEEDAEAAAEDACGGDPWCCPSRPVTPSAAGDADDEDADADDAAALAAPRGSARGGRLGVIGT